MGILNSHLLSHSPKPRLEAIHACGVAGKKFFSLFSCWFCCWQKSTPRLLAEVLQSLEREGAVQMTQVHRGIMPKLLFGRDKLQVIMWTQSFPTLVISPLTPRTGFLWPLLSAVDLPRHGMWWDSPGCIPRHCSGPSRLSVSSPEMCVLFYTNFWPFISDLWQLVLRPE